MNADEIRALVEASSRAAVEAAMASVQNMSLPRRKPDLPDFDTRNIEIWIKRVESAYIRANVTDAKEKFAHLEGKIGVETDPKINEFLFGDANDANWMEFLKYLRTRYGHSKKQQTAVFLDGVKREGRRPSQLLSFIKEKTKEVTVDDLRKELVLRELPAEVQRLLADKADSLTAEEVAAVADKHFDKDGHLLIQPPPTTSSVSFSLPFSQDDSSSGHATSSADVGEINAATQAPRRSFSASRGRGNRGGSNPNNRNQQKTKYSICTFHERFGDKAFKCEAPCLMQGKVAPKGKPEQRA